MATQYTAGLTSGQVLTAAIMNQIGAAWETYTPTWTGTTNPVIGNGTIKGRYARIQKIVVAQMWIQTGTTTTYGTGKYAFSLPVTAAATLDSYPAIGDAYVTDSSASSVWACVAHVINSGTTTFGIKFTGAGFGDVTNTAPFTFAVGDQITANIIYEGA
jgi:hypothetical protein